MNRDIKNEIQDLKNRMQNLLNDKEFVDKLATNELLRRSVFSCLVFMGMVDKFYTKEEENDI